MPAISFQSVSKTYATDRGPFQALDGVSLDIEPGEFFGLLGPNGAGKTTLISILAGLNRAASGRVQVMGHDVREQPALARRQLEVNLIAPLLLGRELARQQATRQATDPGADACVVHLLDQKVFNLNPDYFSYTTSKLALERSVALQAQALAPLVRVCGVAPGLIYPSGPQTDENFARASRVNLLRRAINPQDVANTCRFLAENAGLNGVTLAVDNGQHLIPLERDVMFAVNTVRAKADHG